MRVESVYASAASLTQDLNGPVKSVVGAASRKTKTREAPPFCRPSIPCPLGAALDFDVCGGCPRGSLDQVLGILLQGGQTSSRLDTKDQVRREMKQHC